jgi:hypothetical protein
MHCLGSWKGRIFDCYGCLADVPNTHTNKCSIEFPNLSSALRPVAQTGESFPQIPEVRNHEVDVDVRNKEMDVDYMDREPYLITPAS